MKKAPVLMTDYCDGLIARWPHLPNTPDHRCRSLPAFAEGRLLHIHPFEDFNSRVTCLFIDWLTRWLDLLDVNPIPVSWRGKGTPSRSLSGRRQERLAPTHGNMGAAPVSGGTVMTAIHLRGATPVPLASYLKALGILRLVAEQKDANATGWWEGDHFVLQGDLDKESLSGFLLNEYRPTPILAPWNGGSGFFPKDNKIGIEGLEASVASRFDDYRNAIVFSRTLLDRLGIEEKPEGEEKARLLRQFRAQAPESVLRWFNAAVLLAGEGPRYPPLLGTGGNDGRLDFTNNFMQRLVEIFDPQSGNPSPHASAWLDNALDGKPIHGLINKAIGQFSPGDAGGPNASTGFEAKALINPWDFVLMLEGALAFAAATSRRLESSDNEGMSYPFTVRPTAVGGSGESLDDEKDARAEVWMPLWEAPTTWPELQMLLSEGRARLGMQPVRDGLDFIRAISGLGIDRGIAAFQRYAFLMRSGKAYLATPVSRVQVKRNPDADLIGQLEREGFLQRIRQIARNDNVPGRLRAAVRRLEQALFDLAARRGSRQVQYCLVTCGEVVSGLESLARRDDKPPPPPRLDADWVMRADDGSAEFQIAAAIAGLGQTPGMDPPLACHLLPLDFDGKGWQWHPDSPEHVWRGGDPVTGLAAVARRRCLEASRRQGYPPKPFSSPAGVASGTLAAWLYGTLPGHADRRIADLARGLALCRIVQLPSPTQARGQIVELPAAWYALRAFFTPDDLLIEAGLLPPDGRLPQDARLLQLLLADRIEAAVQLAWRQLAARGAPLPAFDTKHPPALAGSLEGRRLLASLSVPLYPVDLKRGFRGQLRPRAEIFDEETMEEMP